MKKQILLALSAGALCFGDVPSPAGAETRPAVAEVSASDVKVTLSSLVCNFENPFTMIQQDWSPPMIELRFKLTLPEGLSFCEPDRLNTQPATARSSKGEEMTGDLSLSRIFGPEGLSRILGSEGSNELQATCSFDCLPSGSWVEVEATAEVQVAASTEKSAPQPCPGTFTVQGITFTASMKGDKVAISYSPGFRSKIKSVELVDGEGEAVKLRSRMRTASSVKMVEGMRLAEPPKDPSSLRVVVETYGEQQTVSVPIKARVGLGGLIETEPDPAGSQKAGSRSRGR